MQRRALLAFPFLVAGRGVCAQVPLAVTASFSILADMARQVGGARVAVTAIVGPDVDSHGFQARPSDAVALRDAAVVLRNGLGFEPWLDRLLGAAGPRGQVVTVTDGIAPRMMEGHAHSHDHGGAARRQQHHVGPRRVPDPHAWQDLRLAPAYLRNIEAALGTADAAGAATYRANAQAYAARLAVLDAWVRAEIATVPEVRRKIITNHDAFGYFAAAYGVTMLAPQGLSSQGEPSAAALGALIRQARAESISAIFLENASSPAIIQRLASEAGMRVRGRLYADALSAPTGPAPTFEAMVRHNVALMVPAMRGEG